MDTVVFPTKLCHCPPKHQKTDKSSRSIQLAIDGKGLSKDSASVIILFAQKAKYCGGYQLKNVWLFVHILKKNNPPQSPNRFKNYRFYYECFYLFELTFKILDRLTVAWS